MHSLVRRARRVPLIATLLVLVPACGLQGVGHSGAGLMGSLSDAPEGYPTKFDGSLRTTKDKVEGDPINLVVIGTREQLIKAMETKGYVQPQPVTFASGLSIATSVMLKRSMPDAPVSDLFYFGRPQDLAFVKEVDGNARRRHHVRFWQESDKKGPDGQSVWLGAATFDADIGLSKTRRLRFTHTISPFIDKEREEIGHDLESAVPAFTYHVPGIGKASSKNAEGDPFETDGNILVVVIVACDRPCGAPRAEKEPASLRY